ncbi:dihydrolipoyl dehydrogenase [uncultured Sphingomonas sp.]|uniref:dihydrolipoyl dehydrogenase n=1 Tax=uncultured Sphingomonas sp. TaxID=158754 RepID=UPI0035CA91CD
MIERTCDVAIVGAGTAGLKAYKAALAAGSDVLLIEKGPGGSTCTRHGCMPSKLLIAAGRTAHVARGAGVFGIGVTGVTVDGPAVLARMRRMRDGFVQSVLDSYQAIPDERRIHGEARFAGVDTLTVGDTRVTAREIVIAVGATPSVPPPLDPARALIHTHETIFEIADLPRRLAVVGAGPQGLELAQAFARLGVAVTLLDHATAIGHLKDPDAARIAQEAFAGVFDLHLGVEVSAELAGADKSDGAVVRWTGDSAGEVTVDLILVSAGQKPQLDALNLNATGLALDDHGTPCFDHVTRRCGDSGIFIAGDAGVWRPVLHEAARGGRIAGNGTAGRDAPPQRPALAIAFCEPNLVEVGMPFTDLPDGAIVGCAMASENGRTKVDGETAGVVRLYADRDGLMLGATIVAADGEHLGQSVALAIDRGMTLAEFADQSWYHPTVEELLQTAARDGAGLPD